TPPALPRRLDLPASRVAKLETGRIEQARTSTANRRPGRTVVPRHREPVQDASARRAQATPWSVRSTAPTRFRQRAPPVSERRFVDAQRLRCVRMEARTDSVLRSPRGPCLPALRYPR